MEKDASKRTRAPKESWCLGTIPEPDDRETEQQCDHFTIRGFVAPLQQKDPNLCCLSQIFRDHDEEQCKDLCPILAAQFRRWDCSDCLKEVQDEVHGTTLQSVCVGQSTPSKCSQESHSKCISASSSNKGVTEANVYPAVKVDILMLIIAPDVQATPSNHGGDQVNNRVPHKASSNRNDIIPYLKVYQRRCRKKRVLSEIKE
ncbi:unnamed protein product [Urochloa humidicola]